MLADLDSAPVEGAELLDAVRAFLARFVAYPSEDALVAHTLFVAHCHLMDCWESTPRIAFLSVEPGSGKTRALEVSELLVPRPLFSVNCTPAALFRKVSDPDGRPTILFDEIDTIFGPRAKDNEDLRGLLNAGHRKGATATRCVVRGKNVEVEDLPAYSAVALAGLHDLPDTIMSRSIVVRMRRRGPADQVEPFRRRIHAVDGEQLRDRLVLWCKRIEPGLGITWPTMPPGVVDRAADVWEPLFVVADAAGGDWPERARRSAVSHVSTAMTGGPTLGVRLLGDVRALFTSRPADEHLSTDDLVRHLNELDESPWGDIRGKALDARSLARRLKPYDIAPGQVRIGEKTLKGYRREDFVDAWARYIPESPSTLLEEERNTETQVGNLALGTPVIGAGTNETPERVEPSANAHEAAESIDVDEGAEPDARDGPSRAPSYSLSTLGFALPDQPLSHRSTDETAEWAQRYREHVMGDEAAS